jgi:hypothetical protein
VTDKVTDSVTDRVTNRMRENERKRERKRERESQNNLCYLSSLSLSLSSYRSLSLSLSLSLYVSLSFSLLGSFYPYVYFPSYFPKIDETKTKNFLKQRDHMMIFYQYVTVNFFNSPSYIEFGWFLLYRSSYLSLSPSISKLYIYISSCLS